MKDYSARVEAYAADVLSGRVVAGKCVKAASQRHQDDLNRVAGDWPYYFDANAANRVCTFVEMMPHIEGRWSSLHIVLEDWQVFWIASLFGWLNKETGLRRFVRFYVEVARKNGKSPICSAICLYLTFADNEPGAQVYSFATSETQAKVIWNVACKMIAKEPSFASLGAAYNSKAIYCVDTNSKFVPLSKNFETQDGMQVHGFIADEFHAHKQAGQWEVMESATGARKQPLGGGVTTAGTDTSGICYSIRGYVIKILNDVLSRHEGLGYKIQGDSVVDERWFGLIYTIDDADIDDPFNEDCWIKANPNLGISVNVEDMRDMARRARSDSSAINNFLTKKLNVWCNADTAWMDMLCWDECENRDLKIEDFAAEECIVALDLASKIDIACKAVMFKRNEKFYAFVQHYLPDSAIRNSKNSQYEGWARDKHFTVTPGEVTEYDIIEDDVREDCKRFAVKEVPYDPFQATQLAGHLVAEQVPMVEYGQSVKNMSEPMKELQAKVISGKFEHNGDPVLRWMIANVICHTDAKDNIYPRKEKPENKIDGAVALIIAMGRWMVTKEAEPEPQIIIL